MAEKLLANTDRGGDQRFLSRNLVDLAFISVHWPGDVLEAGLEQAEAPYGDTVRRELHNALRLFDDKGYRKSCCAELA